MPDASVKLSFCEIRKLSDDIIEVIIDDGVEVGESEIREYHAFFDMLAHPVGVLVNRANHYSFSFDAQSKVAMHKNMLAVAVLVLEPSMESMAAFDLSVMQYKFPVELFTSRSEALDWLSCHTQ